MTNCLRCGATPTTQTRVYTAEEIRKWAVHETSLFIAEDEYVFRYFAERFVEPNARDHPWRTRPSFRCSECGFEWDLISKVTVVEKRRNDGQGSSSLK